ncbi:MAG: molybdopterin-dependent oxidoreductase [Dehalococcoidia bacterium]
MEISRRDFLKGAGASTAGLIALPSILEGGLRALATAPSGGRPIVWEQMLYQCCAVCASQCGTICYVRDGHIQWIGGNPADGLGGQGKACVKGASAMRHLYDPDRLKSPLKRTNPRKGKDEDPGWVKISWDEAFATIGEQFNKAITDHGPESVVIFSRPDGPCTRLQKAIGTPNQVQHGDVCYAPAFFAWRVMATGGGRPYTMDMENAKYIMGFGWDMPGKSKLCQLLPFLKAKEQGAKVVIFDPRMSLTANMADEWIPIKAGTDLAVLLAMINYVIQEDLYDKEYVENYTYGFAELRDHVKQYTAEWAASISDVPADVIRRIAREFATTKPALLATHKRDAGGPNWGNSFPTAQAQIILKALVGGIEREGGFFFPRRFSLPSVDSFAPVTFPEMKETRRVDGQHLFPLANAARTGSFGHIAQGILSEDPYPVKVGIMRKYNLLAFPNPDTIIEAIKKLDFFAVVDIMPSESCQMADIVLPDMYFLESGGYTSRVRQALWPMLLLREGTGALWENRGWSAIVNGILDAMGKSEFKVDWAGHREACLEAAGTSMAEMRANNGIHERKQELVGRTEFNTPSKKIELYSTILENEGYEPLPSWHEPYTMPSAEYPYRIVVNHLPWLVHTGMSNDPVLVEVQPENFLHMHPDTAANIGVQEFDYVIVDSQNGNSIKLRAHITRGIRKDTVMTEHAFGHWSRGWSVAHDRGTNDGELLPERHLEDSLKIKSYLPCHSAAILDICVNVRKA